MKKSLPFNGIPLLFEETISSLEKNGKIYAHAIKAEDQNGNKYVLREKRGLQVENFIGKPVECILEILECDFIDTNTPKEKLSKDIWTGTFAWSDTGHKFIPILFEMINGHEEDDNYDYDEDEYDRIAGEHFDSWGIAGLGLGIYQNKPMVKTENGVFLFNEYQNEEIIEKWEVGQTIYFRPKEMLLRGIKPYEGKWEKKEKKSKYGFEPKEGESYIVGKPRFLERYG